MEENWYLLSFSLRWPHQGIIVGYELLIPTESDNYYSVRVHLGFLSINYDFGDGECPL
jgi:hypothetical protein